MKDALHKYTKVIVLAAGLCNLFACSSKKNEKDLDKKDKPKFLTAEGFVVRPQQFRNDYTTSGSLLPNEEIQILPEVSGRVISISFQEGKFVKKGQVLLKIYNDDIRAQIRKSKAEKELQVKIKNRQAELLSIGGISKQDYETTGSQIQSIDADIAYSEALLRKTSIIAPFDGRVGIRNVSLGAVVSPATVIATLQQTRLLKMDFILPEQYRNEISAGKKVGFTVTGSLDTFTAVVTATEPSANSVTHTLLVRAIVQNQDNKLVAGSFTHVIIPFENKKNALLIPSQAIIPTTRDKEVAVVRNGKAEMTTVKIGARTSDEVEIIQGLKEGDTIILTGIMQVKQGMTVKVHLPKVGSGKSTMESDSANDRDAQHP